MSPTDFTQAALGTKPVGIQTNYQAVPKAGGWDYFKLTTNQTTGSSTRTPITREQYVAAGFKDPGAVQPTTTAPSGGGSPGAFPQALAYEPAGGAAGGGGTYDAAAAQAAAQEAQKTGLRGTISNLIGSAMDIYKNLYGGLEKQAAAQKGQLETQFGQGLGEVGKQFTTELPKIGQAYAARGAYDSTWRAGAEQSAADAYAKQIADLYKSQQEALGKVGSAYQTEKAKYGVGQSALQDTLSRLGSVTDINELTALQNAIQSKIGDLQVAQAGMGTEAQNVAATQALQGMSDKFAQASKTIQTIVRGQAPAMLKKSIAENIIINSDLTDAEKKQLQDVVNTQIA